MLRCLFPILAICLACVHSFAAVYYVDSQAANPNGTGSSSSPWRSISEAADYPLQAGDVVHIKAGNYGAEEVLFRSSGIPGNPIVFRGYQFEPGDNPEASEPRFYIHASEMPLLNGMNPSAGIAMDLNGQNHIRIENIQIINYRLGIRNMRSPTIESTGIHLENIVGKTFGIQSNAEYSGWGILIDDNNNTIRNCKIIDAGAEGIGIYGDHNLVSNCLVSNYSDVNATDYFILVWGDYNRVEESAIHRAVNISSHSGHGLGTKNGSYNEFVECVSVNTNKGFYVSGPDCHDNYFYHCVAQNAVGIVVREGAFENEFNACVITNTEVAVRFVDSIEFGPQASGAGHDNEFVNCVFEHNKTAIDLKDDQFSSPIFNNSFLNCVFFDAVNLFSINTPSINNNISNCVISNLNILSENNTSQNLSSEGFHTKSSVFWQNDFNLDAEEGIHFDDPEFKNLLASDFRPMPSSYLIENGTNSQGSQRDFSNTERPLDADSNGIAAIDIGIYEYTDQLLLADSSDNQIYAGMIDPFNLEDSLAAFFQYPIHVSGYGNNVFQVSYHSEGESMLLAFNSSDGRLTEGMKIFALNGQAVFQYAEAISEVRLSKPPSGLYIIQLLSEGIPEHHTLIIH